MHKLNNAAKLNELSRVRVEHRRQGTILAGPASVAAFPQSAAAKLTLQKVCQRYHSPHNGQLLALDNIELSVRSGEFLCIVGPSGCGKSTLLHIIAGLTRPASGDVLL